MMRLTWRQHRLQVLIGGVALVLLVPILLMTGREVAQLYQAAVTCTTGCGDALSQLRGYVQDSKVLLLLPLLPLLLGVFVGAPLLARELEQRTHLL